MSKYEIGDEFKGDAYLDAFQRAKVVAFHPTGSAILEVLEEGELPAGALLARTDEILDKYYDLVIPEPPFFEIGKFYRWAPQGLLYARYEIKEIYKTSQRDGSHVLQAHAVRITADEISQAFLDEVDFVKMVKM